jgi:ubiquinone/menaquinone biosynthesis C-methylase UbiE
MKKIYFYLLAGAGAALGAALAWRLIANRRSLPCPSWLSWLLENPLVDTLAGGAGLLDRAGISPGMRVLDAGCGPGRLTLPAARRVGLKGEVVGLDIQPAMIRRLVRRAEEQNVHNIVPLLGALGTGGLAPNSFDRALLVTVLGEIPNRESALNEIYQALKPGGILSVTEILPDPHYQTQAAVRSLASRAGFRPVEVFGSTLIYTINLEKPAA